MELDAQKQKQLAIAVGVLVTLIIIWWFFIRKKPAAGGAGTPSSAAESKKKNDSNRPTIYGSLGCPYTIKQMEKYPDHEFVDCTSGKCPSFVTAYPTTKWPDGKIDIGFS